MTSRTSSAARGGARPRAAARKGGWLKRHWNGLTPRGKRVLVGIVGGGLLLVFVLAGIVWATTPLPDDHPQLQSVTVLYEDGSELGRLQGEENRTEVPLRSLPEHVRRAVLAAEDEGFYDHSGISLTALARAAAADIRGGRLSQGGSTITQQYAKNAFLTRDRTFARKFREAVISIKLERKFSKDEILEDYLNTIYFGRGAYGIEAAAKTYFGVPAAAMSVEQAAVLAALIRAPEGGDPSLHPDRAKRRWAGVLDNMVEEKWLDQAKRNAAKYPAVTPRGKGGAGGKGRLAGQTGYLLEAVRRELVDRGFAEEEINLEGLVVRTSIAKKAQQSAERAMAEVLKGAPGELRSALVAVQPGTGQVRAMYGGPGYETRQFNYATDALRQPGSTFKPLVLATAIDEGIGLRSRYNGRSPQTFSGYTRPVSNYNDEQFGQIDLVAATAHSVNTVYVPLGIDAGVRSVVDMAHRLGVPDEKESDEGLRRPVELRADGSIALGSSEIHVLDSAVAFATFAARGTRAEPYLIEEVKARGKTRYKAERKTAGALPPDVAADVSFALQEVVKSGTGTGARLAGGRPAAGKTGTTQGNTDAWFAGYTPSLSASVWLGFDNPARKLTGILGRSTVTGGSFPASIWKAFMDGALAGSPVQQFPPPAYAGEDRNAVPTATATPSTTPCPAAPGLPVGPAVPVGSPCPTASSTPSATPTVTVSPTFEPTVLPTTESPKPTKSPKPEPSTSTSASPAPPASGAPSGDPSPGASP